MARRKQTGFSPDFQEQLLSLTADSPLLAVGTVVSRRRIQGTNTTGKDWEMYSVEIRGKDGRMTTVTVNDPAGVPPQGEFIVMPCYVGTNGYLREAKQLNQSTF